MVFGGGLLHLSAQSGSASGTSGSGGSGLLNSGGAGGLTANPSLASNPILSGAPISSSSTFGAQYGNSITLGNASSGSGGLTIYEPYVYAPNSQEQSYRSSTYSRTIQQAPATQKSAPVNAPNTGVQFNFGNPLGNPVQWALGGV